MHKQLYVLQKIVSRLLWLIKVRSEGYSSLLAGIDGEVAYKGLDVHDGGNCHQLGLYIDWHCHQIDRNQLGLCINEYIVELIAISLDLVLISILSNQLQSARIVYRWMSTVASVVGLMVGLMVGSMVGSTVGLMVGSTVGSTLLCWAIGLSKAFDISAERLLRLSTERV
jgi:hypothetical protein